MRCKLAKELSVRFAWHWFIESNSINDLSDSATPQGDCKWQFTVLYKGKYTKPAHGHHLQSPARVCPDNDRYRSALRPKAAPHRNHTLQRTEKAWLNVSGSRQGKPRQVASFLGNVDAPAPVHRQLTACMRHSTRRFFLRPAQCKKFSFFYNFSH